MLEITIAELQKLHESEEHIEFKEAKHNYLFAGGKHVDLKDRRRCVLGCIAALANEKGGRLVLRNGSYHSLIPIVHPFHSPRQQYTPIHTAACLSDQRVFLRQTGNYALPL